VSFLATIRGRSGRAESFICDGEISKAASSERTFSEAQLFIPRSSIAWDSDLLREEGGFPVTVFTDKGTLKGVADQPRWVDFGAELTVYGPERWMEIRFVGTGKIFRHMPAATIARAAIRDGVSGIAPVSIAHGTYLFMPPLVREIIFDGQSILDVLTELTNETQQIWWIDDRLRFHWGERTGIYHPEWFFDDGKLLPELQPLPLFDRIGENIEIEPSGRRFSVRREAQPNLWPSQKTEQV